MTGLRILLAGLVLAAQPNSPAPRSGGAVELYRKAHVKMRPAQDAYGRSLLESLESANPYERRLALERLEANPGIVNDDWVPALVRRLSETEPLYDEHCAAMVERLDRSYGGQGEELEYARCKVQGGASNGSRAARLLHGSKWPAEVVAFVMRGPDTVHAVTSSLGPSTAATAFDAVQALARTSDPAIEAALLRLALVGHCAHRGPDTLAAVAQRLRAPPAVGTLAALAYLRLSDCAADDKGYAEPRAHAIAALKASLADAGDKKIFAELALIGPAAHPLVPALLARQKATPGQLGNVVQALGAIGPAAHPSVPTLVALLRDDRHKLWRRDILLALARIGATASGFKEAALEALTADAYVLNEVAAALASAAVRLSPPELDLLERPYRKRCARAGAIYMFNLDRDKDCANIATSLDKLARLAHRSFRKSHWQDGQEAGE